MSFTNARDKRIADEAAGDSQSLQCSARGCPNRWTADDGSGRFCSAHFRQPLHFWPRITEEQNFLVAEHAMRRQMPAPAVHQYTHAEKKAILTGLLGIVKAQPSQDWALKLQAQEEAGVRLTPTQRDMWRSVVRP